VSDARQLGALQFERGSEFSEVRRAPAQGFQPVALVMMRLARGSRLFDLIGQCLRLSPEGGQPRLHLCTLARQSAPRLLLVWREPHHATFQSAPGEMVEFRPFLPRDGRSDRGFHEETHAPVLAFADWARWLSPLNSRIVA